MAHQDPTQLSQVFKTRSSTHEYTIRWTSLGPEDGYPLVFVHGTPWSSRVWVPFAKALSSRYRVYLSDNPGYGESGGGVPFDTTKNKEGTSPDLDASLSGQATALANLFRDCWKFDRPPHVVAHDNGGLLTLRAHLLGGCKYASLCLVDVVAVRPFGSPFFRLVSDNRNVFESIPNAVFEGTVRSYVNGARHKDLPPGIEDMLVKPWLGGGSQGQAAFIRQMVQADQRDAAEVEPRYAEVGKAMPVKIIWGKEDRWIPVDRAQRLGQMLGAQEVVEVEEAGHLFMYDQPERLAIELALWLSDVSHS